MDITDSIHYRYTAVQGQKVVSAYFTSDQIPPFGFVDQYRCVVRKAYKQAQWIIQVNINLLWSSVKTATLNIQHPL